MCVLHGWLSHAHGHVQGRLFHTSVVSTCLCILVAFLVHSTARRLRCSYISKMPRARSSISVLQELECTDAQIAGRELSCGRFGSAPFVRKSLARLCKNAYVKIVYAKIAYAENCLRE